MRSLSRDSAAQLCQAITTILQSLNCWLAVLTSPRSGAGVGGVGNGTDVGLFVHPALAVDEADGSVLGLAAATIWRRTKKKAEGYQALPIEDKESYKWIITAKAACEALSSTALLTIFCEREADIYELFARLPDERTHVLVRATRDRALADKGRLFAQIAMQPEAGRLAFDLPARPRPAGAPRQPRGSLR